MFAFARKPTPPTPETAAPRRRPKAPPANPLALKLALSSLPGLSSAPAAAAPGSASAPPVQRKARVSSPGDPFEREADEVADRLVQDAEPPAVGRTPTTLQRTCDTSRHDHDRGLLRPKAAADTGAPRAERDVAVPSAGGRPLDAATRAYFEPRLGHDLGSVQVFEGAAAAASAEQIGARAYAQGDKIVFGAGQYRPAQTEGRRLLAHELTHVVQQRSSGGDAIIRRDYPWDVAKEQRELDPDKIPTGLSYELQNHKLVAHTTKKSDIDAIVEMVDVLVLYAGGSADRADLTARLSKEREGVADGQRVSIDVTPHLPADLQHFLSSMETYFAAWRKYVAEHGSFEDIFDKHPDDTPERRQMVQDWHAGAPKRSDEFHAACHDFAMIAVDGSAQGVTPGKPPANPFDQDTDALLDSYTSSIAGRGPFRAVKARDVQIGDIAVFRAGTPITGLPSRIIHSAIVIRVTGSEVELLEKKNPGKPLATRTVAQVLAAYSRERAKVHYVTPAMAGMPITSPDNLGAAAPSEAVTTASGVAPEDTHVLFVVDTAVLKPHEDRKLFALVARQKGAARVKVHGYASQDGDAAYNVNLSAHRAVTVKSALLGALPGGSTAEAFARGPTSAFGGPDENRRAGIEITSAPQTPASDQEQIEVPE